MTTYKNFLVALGDAREEVEWQHHRMFVEDAFAVSDGIAEESKRLDEVTTEFLVRMRAI